MNEGVWKWNQAEILRYLGCKGQPVPENVEFLIEECKRELEQCAAPGQSGGNFRWSWRGMKYG